MNVQQTKRYGRVSDSPARLHGNIGPIRYNSIAMYKVTYKHRNSPMVYFVYCYEDTIPEVYRLFNECIYEECYGRSGNKLSRNDIDILWYVTVSKN